METILKVSQVLVAISMIAIILVQRGAGAAAGSGFGAGASATVFGARGSGSFLTRSTAVLAALFFGISLVMAVMAGQATNQAESDDLGVMAGVVTTEVEVSDVPLVPSMESVESTDVSDVPAVNDDAEDEAMGEDVPTVEPEDTDG